MEINAQLTVVVQNIPINVQKEGRRRHRLITIEPKKALQQR